MEKPIREILRIRELVGVATSPLALVLLYCLNVWAMVALAGINDLLALLICFIWGLLIRWGLNASKQDNKSGVSRDEEALRGRNALVIGMLIGLAATVTNGFVYAFLLIVGCIFWLVWLGGMLPDSPPARQLADQSYKGVVAKAPVATMWVYHAHSQDPWEDEIGSVNGYGFPIFMGHRIGPRANLRGVDLSSQNLSAAMSNWREDHVGAMMNFSNFSNANLSGSNLSNLVLEGSDFSNANLAGARLNGALTAGIQLAGACLRGTNLAGTDLRGQDLRSLDMRRANLSGADLRKAFLSGADLSDADLRGAKLTGVKLGGVNLDGIIWNAQTVWPSGFSPPPSRRA